MGLSRAFFVTVQLKNIINLNLDYLLNDDNTFPSDGTGEFLLNTICEEFVNSADGRLCGGSACVSADGLFHLHLGCYSPKDTTFKKISDFFGSAHVEEQRGTKKQLLDYITKSGDWAEKGEKILYVSSDLSAFVGGQGKRSDLSKIEEYLNQGLTPSEIFSLSFSYRRYDKMIREAYYDLRKVSTPFFRDVKVIWHVGEAGSGKSYCAKDIVDKFGEESLYMLTDYDSGGLDKYNGQSVLFMDEFRGQIRYSTLLGILDGYKIQIHCRYSNCLALWDTVHITSVLPPELVYHNMVSEHQELDTIQQLKRRINTVVYHWRDEEGLYKQFEVPMERYVDYNTLREMALNDGFLFLSDTDKLPFK